MFSGLVKLTIGVGICCISLTSLAESPSESKADKYSNFFYKTTPPKQLVSKVAGSTARVGQSVVSETQALFLMASLASIEGMKQKLEISGIKKEKASLDDLSKVAMDSASELVQRSDTWAGLAGMAVTNKGMQASTGVWNSLVATAGTQSLLKDFLAGSSATLVGFLGFEAGAELMSRAIEMMPDEVDREKATKMMPTIWSAITNPDANQSAEDRRIIAAVFGNLYEILVSNSELREKWWSFVMRNRVGTGNFAVGVSMMSMGSVLGAKAGACAPQPIAKVAAPVVGAIFGVGAGVAAAFVPQETKDSITKGIQTVRIYDAEKRIGQLQMEVTGALHSRKNDKAIFNAVGLGKTKWYEADMKAMDKKLDSALQGLEGGREELMTAMFDKTHLINSRLYSVQNKIQLAKEFGNAKALKELSQEREELLKSYTDLEKSFDLKIQSQVAFLESAKKKANETAIVSRLNKEMEVVNSLKKWAPKLATQIRETSTWGQSPKKGENLMSEVESQRLLDKVYMWGFKEKPFVETMEFSN